MRTVARFAGFRLWCLVTVWGCLLLWLLTVWCVDLLIVAVACFACDGCWLVVLFGGLARCWWFGLVLWLVCALV